MAGGGALTVTTRLETDYHVREHGTAPNRFIWVDLADEGCGIREEDLAHIFSPFFTTKNNGTGLGLATCYRIIKEHGGTIRVDSIEERAASSGSRWWWLTNMDQGKILVTEDEESLRFVLQKALETEGYWVQTAANGASARRLLTDTHFDISLMDIKLPDVDGLVS